MKEASFRGHTFKFDETTWKPYTQISWFITDPTGDIAHRDKFFWPRPDEVVIDVGASCGGPYTIPAAICGAHVYAFEPDPMTSYALRTNTQLNNLEHLIDISDCAIGAENSITAFNGSLLVDKYKNDDRFRVKCFTLDHLALTGQIKLHRLDWIKIDVEGAELDVLDGARQTIVNYKPRILIDLHPHLVNNVEHKILDWFNELHIYYNSHFTQFSDRITPDTWYWRTYHYIDK